MISRDHCRGRQDRCSRAGTDPAGRAAPPQRSRRHPSPPRTPSRTRWTLRCWASPVSRRLVAQRSARRPPAPTLCRLRSVRWVPRAHRRNPRKHWHRCSDAAPMSRPCGDRVGVTPRESRVRATLLIDEDPVWDGRGRDPWQCRCDDGRPTRHHPDSHALRRRVRVEAGPQRHGCRNARGRGFLGMPNGSGAGACRSRRVKARGG